MRASQSPGLTYQWLRNGQPIEGATNPDFTATLAGSYQVSAVLDGCPGISPALEISVNPLPDIRITPANPAICVGGSVVLTATGGSTYVWAPAEGLSSTTGAQVTASPAVTTAYTVTGTDAKGCVNTNTITIVVNPLPEVEVTASETVICAGESVTLVATGAPAFNWSPAESLNTTTGGTVVATPMATTTYRVVGVSGVGCEDVATITITVKPLPDVLITNDTVCLFEPPFTLSAVAAVSGTGTWSAPGLPAGALTPEGLFNPQLAGISFEGHQLVYTFKEDGPEPQCENRFTKRVVVFPNPEPVFEIDTLLCVGVPINFTNRTVPFPGDQLTYVWRFGDGATANTPDAVHAYTDTVSFIQVGLFAFSRTGCVDSTFRTVSVVGLPQPGFTKTMDPASGCGPVTVQLNNTSQGRALQFRWDFGNGNTSTALQPESQVFQPSLFQDTTYYIRLSLDNLCGDVSFTDSVVVKPAVKVKFIPELDEFCANSPLRLFNFSIGKPTLFTWDFGDGTPPLVTADTGFVVHSFRHTGLSDTIFTVRLTAQSDCNVDVVEKPVKIIQNILTAFFNVDRAQGCAPLAVNFTSNQVGRNSIFWLWGDAPGNGVTGGINQTYTYNEPGTYLAQLVIVNGCHIDTFSREIVVQPSPTAGFTSQDAVCLGSPFVFQNTSSVAFGSEWTFGDGTRFSGANPPAKTYQAIGNYEVTLTVRDPVNGCTNVFVKQVRVEAFPVPAFTLPSPDVCQSEPIAFSNTTTGAQSYFWRVEQGNFIRTTIAETPGFSLENTGLYTITLIAYSGPNQTGCADSVTRSINVLPKPRPLFRIAREIDCGVVRLSLENLTDFPANRGEGTLSWDFGNGSAPFIGFQDIPVPQYTNFTNTVQRFTITLTATTSAGCTQQYAETIEVEPTNACPVNIPNAFTPNGDGENDRFFPKFILENVVEYEMQIFSRWGDLLYAYKKTDRDLALTPDDPFLPDEDLPWQWNGTYRGQPCSHEVYAYKITIRCCSGNKVVRAGEVLLIR